MGKKAVQSFYNWGKMSFLGFVLKGKTCIEFKTKGTLNVIAQHFMFMQL